MSARVIVLAGPSGAGKTRVANQLGLPVVRLDDFYKDGADLDLPRIQSGPNAGLIDWDHPDSWSLDEAVAAIDKLCSDGVVELPTYELAKNARTGSHSLTLDRHELVVAEGIFATEVIAALSDRDLLERAYCVTQHPWLTFGRRLVRDLRERRKAPWVLVRRGLALKLAQPGIVAAATAAGCTPMTGDAVIAQFEPVQ